MIMKLTSVSLFAAALAAIAGTAIAAPRPMDHGSVDNQQHLPHQQPAFQQHPPPIPPPAASTRRRQQIQAHTRTAARIRQAINASRLAAADADYAVNLLGDGPESWHFRKQARKHRENVVILSKKKRGAAAAAAGRGGQRMTRRRRDRKQAERARHNAHETSENVWDTLHRIHPWIKDRPTLGRYAYGGHGMTPPPNRGEAAATHHPIHAPPHPQHSPVDQQDQPPDYQQDPPPPYQQDPHPDNQQHPPAYPQHPPAAPPLPLTYDERRRSRHTKTAEKIEEAIDANKVAAQNAESTANRLAAFSEKWGNLPVGWEKVQHFRGMATKHSDEVPWLLWKAQRHREAARPGSRVVMMSQQRESDYREAEKSRERAEETSSEALEYAARIAGH